jgi:hypothetical protein
MADKTVTVSGQFKTREAAETAIEHLVQQFGIDRADVFVQPVGSRNSAGTEAAGADAGNKPDEAARPVLNGLIEVSADVASADQRHAEEALRAAGAEAVRVQ